MPLEPCFLVWRFTENDTWNGSQPTWTYLEISCDFFQVRPSITDFNFVVPCRHTCERRMRLTAVLSLPGDSNYDKNVVCTVSSCFLSVNPSKILRPLPPLSSFSFCPNPPIPTPESSVSSFWWCSVATTQCGVSEIFMLTHIYTHLKTHIDTNTVKLFLPLCLPIPKGY